MSAAFDKFVSELQKQPPPLENEYKAVLAKFGLADGDRVFLQDERGPTNEEAYKRLRDADVALEVCDVEALQKVVIVRGQRVAEFVSAAEEHGEMMRLFGDAAYEQTVKQCREAFNLMEVVADRVGVDHGLFYHTITSKQRSGGDSKTVDMHIDITNPSGRSLAVVKCVSCAREIGHFDPRYTDLDHGPDPIDQCEACYKKKPHSAMMGCDKMNRLHVRASIAGPTVAVSLCNAFRAFSDRPFIGKRAQIVGKDGKTALGAYEWTTLGTVKQHAFALACGLRKLVARRSTVGICGPNSEEWVASDFACCLNGFISVGLHLTLSKEALVAVIQHAKLSAAIVSGSQAKKFIEASSECPSLRLLVVFDDHVHAQLPSTPPKNVSIVTLHSLLSAAYSEDELRAVDAVWSPPPLPETKDAKKPASIRQRCQCCKKNWVMSASAFNGLPTQLLLELPVCSRCFDSVESDTIPQVKDVKSKLKSALDARFGELNAAMKAQLPALPEDIFTVLYTSGTTGQPKGVPQLDRQWNGDTLVPNDLHPLVQVSYIPLSHSSDRLRVWSTAFCGGRVGICRYGSDTSGIADLVEDITELRPTCLLAPPRIWNGNFASFLQEVDARVHALLEGKDDSKAQAALEKQVSQELLATFAAKNLGGRLQAINTGAAPTAPAVMEFMRQAFTILAKPPCAVSEGYGATEAGGIAYNAATSDSDGWTGLKLMESSQFQLRADGKVGRQTKLVELKLVDVPELGFLTSDVPHPRGEIVVRSDKVAPTYFLDAAASDEVFHDGWYHTGDIGLVYAGWKAKDPSELRIRIIDRKKNVFKLAMGEKFSPGKLEALYETAACVGDICIHGEPSENYVIAIVVPNKAWLAQWAGRSGVDEAKLDFKSPPAALKLEMHTQLVALGRQKELLQFEIPHDVILEGGEWTVESGIRNTALKLNRRAVAERYRSQIDSVYATLRKKLPATPGLNKA